VLPHIALVVGGVQVGLALHALAIVVGVAVGAALALRRAREPRLVLLAVPVVAFAGLVGSRALFALLHGGAGLWTGGLASSGGVAAGLAAAWLVARRAGRPVVEVLDSIAPAAIAALGIGRIGCFLAGCCFGTPTALPWGVVFPALGPPARHPLQLYSAAGDLVLAAFLLAPAPSGVTTRRACVGLGVLRLLLETWRDASATDVLRGGWLTLPQAAASALVVGGFVLARSGAIDYASAAEDTRRWPMRSR
jgi:phosphatidylglycerol:prolipoprotein diacylglycerol transferase